MDTPQERQHGNGKSGFAPERRHFLKTVGGAAGLAALFGADALRGVEAAVAGTTGMTPQQAAAEETLWSEVQQAFSISRSLVNLDNGYTCPAPRVVTEAVIRYIWEQEPVPYGPYVQESRDKMAVVKTGLARIFGCDTGEIAVVRNATEALKTVLYGFPLKPGDEVLTTTQDYGSMVATLRHREQRGGIKLTQIDIPAPPKSMDEVVGLFERAFTPKTRFIFVSHISYTTVMIFPVKKICDMAHERGLEVVVDGAHAYGHLDFKHADLDCDYYGTSLHKWLLAPKGTGMLYIRKPYIEKIPPLMSGPSPRQNARMRKYESVGTQSMAPLIAIGEAIAFHNAIGSKRKEERLRYLKNYWAGRLQKTSKIKLYTSLVPEMSAGLAAVGIDGVDMTGLQEYLWEEHRIRTSRGIYARGEEVQWVRVTVSLYTAPSELD
ncbi:MAG: aminotransferase class V-fold PLP-dependent enzyme [candidate division Zixibacteria bacterium]|nr:aminotransferase class V-fold PLP-dependent enzyme [candidate division Zixibacteria bacterium]